MTDARRDGSAAAGAIRVCFFFNAQRHQLLHGVPTAVALARTPGFEVHVSSPSRGHVEYARRIAGSLGGARIEFSETAPPLLASLQKLTGAAVPPKVVSLGLLARRLNGYDAIAVPERTSILLKRLGASSPHYIHLDHGAGDRAAGFDPRIREYDLVLIPGAKHLDRMSREGLIHPGRHAVVGYPKFDAADAMRDAAWRPFADRKPAVLYNPHFSELGSWRALGEPVLRAFAAQDRYNLIVAPHVRMLDGKAQQARWRTLAEAYAAHPHIHIDTGSDRCVDMTYTTVADIYLGDVSSQVYEFLRTPRPCVFLDAHGVAWQADENYAHWRFGPVARSADRLLETIDHAVSAHWRFLDAQIEGFDATFATGSQPASVQAAQAIAAYLRDQQASSGRRTVAASEPPRRLAQAAALAASATVGWLAHGALGPNGLRAEPAFVEEAVSSHQTTLVRAAMRSQPEIRVLDPVEIRRVTGIRVPQLPARWLLADVQIYPSDWGPIVQIAVTTEQGEHISLVAMRIDTPSDGRPMLENHKGDRIAYWEAGGQAYGIVGAVPAKRLLRMASEVAAESRAGVARPG